MSKVTRKWIDTTAIDHTKVDPTDPVSFVFNRANVTADSTIGTLSVLGTSNLYDATVSQHFTSQGPASFLNLTNMRDLTTSSGLYVGTDETVAGNLKISGTLGISSLSMPGNLFVGGDATVMGNLDVEKDVVGKIGTTSNLGSATRRWANLYMASNIDYASDLIFISGVEKVRITVGGNVGIGTNSPAELLHVYKNQNATTRIRVTNTTSGINAYSSLQLITDSGKYIQLASASTGATTSGLLKGDAAWLYSTGLTNGFGVFTLESNPLYLGTNNVERVTITGAQGIVGIGTISPDPSSKLHVYGSSTAMVYVTANGVGSPAVRLFQGASVYGDLFGYVNHTGSATGNHFMIKANVGDISLVPATGNSALCVSGSNDFVGIGNTSPIYLVDANASTSGAGLRLKTTVLNGSAFVLIDSNHTSAGDNSTCMVSFNVAGSEKASIGWASAYNILAMGPVANRNAVCIDTGSNVGIGSTTPGAKLDVEGDIVGRTAGTSNLGSATRRWANLYMASNIDYQTDMTFSASAVGRVWLKTGGNLGIGTTSPLTLLHVYGAATVSSLDTSGGNINLRGTGNIQNANQINSGAITSTTVWTQGNTLTLDNLAHTVRGDITGAGNIYGQIFKGGDGTFNNILATNINTTNFSTSNFGVAHLDASRIDATSIFSSYERALRVDSSRIDTTSLYTPYASALKIDSSRIDTTSLYTPYASASRLDASRIDTTAIFSSYGSIFHLDSSRIDSTTVIINSNNIISRAIPDTTTTYYFSGSYGAALRISADRGNSWSSYNSGMGTNNVLSVLAYDTSHIYAGTTLGVYKKRLSDTTWSLFNTGLNHGGAVYFFYVDGTTVYAGTNGLIGSGGDWGLNRTTLDGTSWSLCSGQTSGFPLGGLPYCMLKDGTTLYVCTSNALMYSIDNAFSWSHSITSIGFYKILKDGTDFYLSLPNGGGLRKSNDPKNSSSWFSPNFPNNINTFDLILDGTTIFAGAGAAGLYKSINHGISWSTPGGTSSAFGLDGTRLISNFSSTNWVNTSDNYGSTWTAGLNTGAAVRALSVLYDVQHTPSPSPIPSVSNLYSYGDVTTSAGYFESGCDTIISRSYNYSGNIFNGFGDTSGLTSVFRVSNNGTLTNTNIVTSGINCDNAAVGTSFSIPIRYYAATSSDVYDSTTSTSWNATGLTGLQVNALLNVGSIIFAGTQTSGVYYQSFSRPWNPTALVGTTIYSLANYQNYLFAGLSTQVQRSTDFGQSWTTITTYGNVTVFALLVDGTNLWAGTNGSGLQQTTVNGSSFTQIDGGGFSIYDMVKYETNLYVVTGASNSFSKWDGITYTGINMGNGTYAIALDSTRLFIGTQIGLYTSIVSDPFTITYYSSLGSVDVRKILIDGTNIDVGTWGGGVHRSTDYGTTWSTVNTGLGNLFVGDMLSTPTSAALSSYSNYTIAGYFGSVNSSVVSQSLSPFADMYVGLDSTAAVKFRVNSTGQIYSSAGTTIITPADFAEWTKVKGPYTDYEVGDVVTQSDEDLTVEKAEESDPVYGVITDRATFCGGLVGGDKKDFMDLSVGQLEEKYNAKRVAMVGHVPVKVFGIIDRKDYLAVSDIPGVAKAAVISEEKVFSFGIARQSYDGTNVGLIEVRLK